jgi:serine protease AprX
MPIITINGNSLEHNPDGARLTTQADAIRAHPSTSSEVHTEAEDASKSDYVLVQTKDPISTHQKVELANLGLVPHKYVSENAYLYGYKKTDLKVIRDLPFVVWADVYPQYFVIAPDLKNGTGPTEDLQRVATRPPKLPSTASLEVDVIVHRDVDPSADHVKAAIASAAHVLVGSLNVSQGKIRLSIDSTEHLDDIAAIDAVQLIQKVYPVALHNNIARQILKADVVGNLTPYKGSGEVVAVADTGFDKGSTTDTHPAFTGRVKKLYAIGRRGPDKVDDPNGHGTHVSGSVLGDGVSANPLTSNLADGVTTASGSKGGKIQGTAPQASLVVQSLMVAGNDQNPGLAVPTALKDLFLPPYLNDHARVHSNSWGTRWQGHQMNYDASSAEIDTFVWQHPDLVICFSAGNDGTDQVVNTSGSQGADGVVDLGSVGQYASAKNCIAVGASESVREEMKVIWGKWWPSDFSKDPVAGDKLANNKNGMAAFSSRGPTNSSQPKSQQRFKPDLVAPGTFILSARSRRAVSDGWGTTSDKLWFWEGGTSMSTPLVAGCAAVVRESLVKNGTPSPSAALVKALLINGADELRGQYAVSEAGKSPNNNSGFGRVNLQQSVINPHRHPHDPNPHNDSNIGFAQGAPLQQGAQKTYPILRPSGEHHDSGDEARRSTTFKVTLVWSDPAGEVLQNDLDLIVIASDGRERHGNMGTSPGFDRVNNVEQVVWSDLPRGDVTVVVKAFRITDGPDPNDGPQPYALAWRFS